MFRNIISFIIGLSLLIAISAFAQDAPLCRTQALIKPGGPEICVGLVLLDENGNLKQSFRQDEKIRLDISLENFGQQDVVTSEGFSSVDLHLTVHFRDSENRLITATGYTGTDEPPSSRHKLIANKLVQVVPVEILTPGFVASVEPFDAKDYYLFSGSGPHSATVVISMVTYPLSGIFADKDGALFSRLPHDWDDTLFSNTEDFEITPIRQSICSTLGDDPKPSLLDQDIYSFEGQEGEKVSVLLEKSGDGNNGNRATLILKKKFPGRRFFKIDRSALPNKIEAVLPASGEYRIIVAEQPRRARGKRYRGDYCLTLESSQDAFASLSTTAWVENTIP